MTVAGAINECVLYAEDDLQIKWIQQENDNLVITYTPTDNHIMIICQMPKILNKKLQ